MTAVKSEQDKGLSVKNNLFSDYPRFYADFYLEVKKAIKEFFAKDYNLRFMGISGKENILFYGDEYFVNKISVIQNGDFKVKISSGVISNFLDTALGISEKRFELKNLTDIEAMLIKSFTVFLYKRLESNFDKSEVNKKTLQNSKEYNFTFYVKSENKHIGKIIVSLPDFLILKVPNKELKDIFTISDFKNAAVNLRIAVGRSKITLNDIKAIEDGDIILLEDSDINTMFVSFEGKDYKFKINPNPSLIIRVDNNGGNEMEEEASVKSQNMWDSILVDIVAEFDNVKLTLGELKQISEGLVIDVGSVYDNKIKLRVENQVVATGELVILNDRYGVRIDSVKKSKEAPKAGAANTPLKQNAAPSAAATGKPSPKAAPSKSAVKPEAQKRAKPAEGDENFDYSDFEIEDESI